MREWRGVVEGYCVGSEGRREGRWERKAGLEGTKIGDVVPGPPRCEGVGGQRRRWAPGGRVVCRINAEARNLMGDRDTFTSRNRKAGTVGMILGVCGPATRRPKTNTFIGECRG